MKKILLFGAGKSATSLIQYLIGVATQRDWRLVVAENNLSLAESKIGGAPCARAVAINVAESAQRDALVEQADIVISLLPPALHHQVALSCLKARRNLLTASYVDESIRALAPAVRENGLLFLCEMGLDPGIDHMSALHLIGEIKAAGCDRILSFHSHTGGLVAPESDDNPWHYKISWNPRNVVLAGAAGAQYKADGLVVTRAYAELWDGGHPVALAGGGDTISGGGQIAIPGRRQIAIPGVGPLAWYPNRDSLPYIDLYGLQETESFIRTTLRHPDFLRAWGPIVRAGLTDDQRVLDGIRTFADWSAALLPLITPDTRPLYEFLGLLGSESLPAGATTSADILQYLLENRLAMQPRDKDMIVMQHEIGFIREGKQWTEKSTLVVKGQDHLHTAMAKTVGLPLGIAARLVLEGRIDLTGLHIPIVPELYLPVLKELEEQGIRFERSVTNLP
jgi:saccharopine dehydrogenase-like NADP-dependent oxidoreductase